MPKRLNQPKRILACTDLSENSRAALREALFFAETFGAELTVVHVISDETVNYEALEMALADTMETRALEEIRNVAELHSDAVDFDCVVKHGRVVKVILQMLEEDGYDLCVVGTHGRSGFAPGRLGSIAERLVVGGQSDFLLVRPEHSGRPQSISVATDFSALAKTALERGLDLAVRFKLEKVGLLHVYHLPESYYLTGLNEQEVTVKIREHAENHAKELLDSVDNRGIEIELVIEEGKEANAISKITQDRNTDILVLGSHGRTPLGQTLIGSTAMKIMRSCPASMWVETEQEYRINFLGAIARLMGLADD